jgi:hypothetical protein
LKAEFSLMLRLLGPHQGIRLERLRAELDDIIEIGSLTNIADEANYGLPDIDQTGLVEKSIPEIVTQPQLYSEPIHTVSANVQPVKPVKPSHAPPTYVAPAPVQPAQAEPVSIDSAFEALAPVQPAASGPPVSQSPPAAVANPLPAVNLTGVIGDDGYEWLQYEGSQYYRIANSGSEWAIWQG